MSSSLVARGMSGCSFIFAYSFCYSFIARAVHAGHCVYIFHCSPGVCRAVHLFSLSLYIIHSLLALYMRGSACVYFISRSGYVGQCLCVYFHTQICAFDTSIAHMQAMYVSYNMPEILCFFIFSHIINTHYIYDIIVCFGHYTTSV